MNVDRMIRGVFGQRERPESLSPVGGMDRVIDREDAALGARHPEAFAAYANDVRRWFGRKRAARLES